MKVSGLISVLENLKGTHGDLDVVVNDADTGWLFSLQERQVSMELTSDKTRTIQISCDYNDEFYPS